RERRVIAHQAEVVVRDLDLAQVHRLDGPVADLDLVVLAGAVVGDAQRVAVGRGAVPLGFGLLCCLFLLLGRHHPSFCVRNSLLTADTFSWPSIARCPYRPSTKPASTTSAAAQARRWFWYMVPGSMDAPGTPPGRP